MNNFIIKVITTPNNKKIEVNNMIKNISKKGA